MNPEESKKTAVSVGPFGSSTERGIPFNDGIHSAVKGLAIEYLEGRIISNVRFEYDDDGISVWSDKHGEVKIALDLLSGFFDVLSDDNKVRRERIRFNYPDEFLTAVHGRYSENLFGKGAVDSLTFKTNRNTYGPFGWTSTQNEKLIKVSCFSVHMPGSKIVGFHGRSGSKWSGGVYSIGAYVKPYHQQIEPPSKALMLYPSESPRLPEFHSQTRLNKDDRPQNHKHYAVSNIQVSRNEGDHNGAFHLGDIYANCYIEKAFIEHNQFQPNKSRQSK